MIIVHNNAIINVVYCAYHVVYCAQLSKRLLRYRNFKIYGQEHLCMILNQTRHLYNSSSINRTRHTSDFQLYV